MNNEIIAPIIVITNVNNSFTAFWSEKKSGALVTVCTDCIVVGTTVGITDGDGIGIVMSIVFTVVISMVSTVSMM